MVQWDEEAQACRGIYGPVPAHKPQVAVSAEHEAVLRGSAHASLHELLVDCKAVVDSWKQGRSRAAAPGKLYGGTWRHCHWDKYDDVVKAAVLLLEFGAGCILQDWHSALFTTKCVALVAHGGQRAFVGFGE